MMTGQEDFSLQRKQSQVLLSAPFFSVIRVVEFFGNLQNKDMVIFGEQFPAFGDGRNGRRTTSFFPKGIAPEHAFESYPLANLNVVPGNPPEIRKAVFTRKSFNGLFIYHDFSLSAVMDVMFHPYNHTVNLPKNES